ncbi:hypothetical protein QTG54_015703 [Skeletonema marinoi]|uniref:MYND-type domain-containing protein n=1 Tax=Skeletonema marinoi TaxID=267567 RepID=A0AAD8XUJ7_9STRA|nr:hypothetical protein QTG54_015703 [Skeletonema marinoi]
MTTSESEMLLCCAACGIAEVDDVKLKECADCDLARFCSDTCQENHKSQHEEACKKRAAELRDELLFKQPDNSHLGDCPICFLPLPLDLSKATMHNCCSKVVCYGCHYISRIREMKESLQHRCPFCREPIPSTEKECEKQKLKRIEVNDPVAMCHKGGEKYNEGKYPSAFEWYTRAAGLGDVEAHFELSHLYRDGHGVEKDGGKDMYHLKEAAIGGHPDARYELGIGEWNNGNTERAVKHWIIAATQGDDDSVQFLMEIFKEGHVSKDDLAAALRAHQAAVDATKSPQREAAEELQRRIKSV